MTRMRYVPFVSKMFRIVDHNVGRHGFVKGMKKSFAEISEPVEVTMTPLTRNVLKKDKVLVLANHPFVDGLAIIPALPERKNVKIVATIEFMNCAPNMNEHLLFVDTRHHKKVQSDGRLFHAIIAFLNPIPKQSYKDAHKKNIETISQAAHHVNNGGLVALIPSSNSKDGSWHKGVGHLLHAIEAEKTYIVNAHVTGSLVSELLRSLPFLSFFIPRSRVIFQDPIPLSEIYESDPYLNLRNAENRYVQWEKSLKPQRSYFVKRWIFSFVRILDL